MTHKWNYQPITPEQAEASQQLAQELGISPILGKLLVERGITTAADARKFFRPQLPDLYDPFLMKDMDIAVERLNKAMGKKERILVYGDYDRHRCPWNPYSVYLCSRQELQLPSLLCNLFHPEPQG